MCPQARCSHLSCMTVTQSPHYSLSLSPRLSSRKKDSNCFIVLRPWLNECVYIKPLVQVIVQSLSRVQLFPTPWNAAHQTSLAFTVSQNLLKLRSIESDAIQPSHPLSSPSPPAPNPSQHQSLFQWVNSLHQVAKVLELQLQHQSFQWILRIDFL